MAVQARLSPYLPKCHIVGNHMSWLICRLRPFLGVQNLLISIFLGFSCIHCICLNKSIPPTHTQTLGIHVRLSAPGFGAHRICACADPDFHWSGNIMFKYPPTVEEINQTTTLNQPFQIEFTVLPAKRATFRIGLKRHLLT